MTGFYGDLGWLHQTVIKPQDKRFWRFWRWWVLGTGYKTGGFVGDIGVDGGDGGDSNGVGCWLNGWLGVGMVSQSKCSMSNS